MLERPAPSNYRNLVKDLIFLAIIPLVFFLHLLLSFLSPKRHRCSFKKNPEKILLIRLDHIGDLLVSTPAIRALRNLYPAAEITCLIHPQSKELLEDNPNVDKIITLSVSWYGHSQGWLTKLPKILKTIILLRKKGYDIVISLRPYFNRRDHLLSFLIGAPRRIGYATHGGSCLLTATVPYTGEKHIIELIVDTVRFLGFKDYGPQHLEIYYSKDDEIYAKRILKDCGISPDNLVIGLSPTAAHPFLWTEEGFAQIATTLVTKYETKVVFTGLASDEKLIENIRDRMSVHSVSMAGKTNIKQLATLISKFDLLICLDSAPRHIASAVGTPVIFLRHGGDSNIVSAPYGEQHYMVCHSVPCAPCYKVCPTRKCVTKISPSQVLLLADRILQEVTKEKRHWPRNGRMFEKISGCI